MKRYTLVAALILSTMAIQPALAVDAHHPDQKAGVAAPTADQTIQKMQANTARMKSQLEKMAQSDDPAQRQKLMQEHMQTMQENMMAGKSMMGGMTGCPMMKNGMMDGMGAPGSDEGMSKRMDMMEKRMDMMQMMMQSSRGQPQGGAPALAE